MKRFSRLFLVVMVTITMAVSACGGSSSAGEDATSSGSTKPLASLIEVSGYIEFICFLS